MNQAGKALARLVDTRALTIMASLYKAGHTDLADDIKRLVDKTTFDGDDPESPESEVVALAGGEAQVWVPYEPKASNNNNLYDVAGHNVRILRTIDADEFWSAVVGSGWSIYTWWHDYNFLVGDDEICGQIEVKMWSDPDDHTAPLMVKAFTVEDLARAFNQAVEQGYVDPCDDVLDIDNLDAHGGDIVMQMAMLGEVPYRE